MYIIIASLTSKPKKRGVCIYIYIHICIYESLNESLFLLTGKNYTYIYTHIHTRAYTYISCMSPGSKSLADIIFFDYCMAVFSSVRNKRERKRKEKKKKGRMKEETWSRSRKQELRRLCLGTLDSSRCSERTFVIDRSRKPDVQPDPLGFAWRQDASVIEEIAKLGQGNERKESSCLTQAKAE